ncbi:MAG: hypothetical protein AUJ85_01025 [Elusimicrobia bacterium CG1_02_37_114]|nr:MAG: hypothetical protein AUJ85_01025 [Elusimicrobia bacterium CG1_02_37_114]PIV53593.1 MAG: hypothetical protein COS17_03080 [Elusimicrobia bacterium CG02_land_8_20_14_3_00_37_13]PIZ13726.1 MAG: hypothetical protein COY53_03380 [Elusimicrobia bacterium CG_4_10_14_0_8_um_filter_37_32]
MAKTQNKIKEIIKEYIVLLSQDIEIRKIILFGSFAKGKHYKDSDIDLAIISPDFRDKDHIENMKFLIYKTINLEGPPIEPLPYTPEEYKKCDSRSFLAEIKRTGKVIFSH